MKFYPKPKQFSHRDLLRAWVYGQMSVIEFVQYGGSLAELKDIIVATHTKMSVIDKSGMTDEMYQKINRNLGIAKEKADDEIKRITRTEVRKKPTSDS